MSEATTYDSIEYGVPFRILHPRHNDMTVWRKDESHSGGHILRMYWHGDKFWINPPTDSSMETQAIKKANKYGVVLLPKDYDKQYEARREQLLSDGVNPWDVDGIWFSEQLEDAA